MIRVIPAIDLIDGQVIRLTRGSFEQKTFYSNSPLEIAKEYQEAGMKYLHLVDLDGARAGTIKNHKILEQIADNTSLIIDFGGGIRTEKDIRLAFNCGASQVTLGSVAVSDKASITPWIKKYSPAKFILGADSVDGKITIAAWQDKTGIDLFGFIESYYKSGIQSCISTDVRRDGTMSGPAFELYRAVKKRFPRIFLIASGGVHHVEDVRQLDQDGIDGVIIGKALYEGKIELTELREFSC